MPRNLPGTRCPEVNIQLQTGAHGLGDGVFEVTLTVTVTAKLAEKTVFLVEVGQAGIFRIKNVPEDNLQPLLSIACPNILFPYAREVVSDSITRAGFAPSCCSRSISKRFTRHALSRNRRQRRRVPKPSSKRHKARRILLANKDCSYEAIIAHVYCRNGIFPVGERD